MKKRAHLALVRHGESLWNAQGLWTGWQDIPLSEHGREEARIVAQALHDIPFQLAITSDLARASETLEIIKKELGLLHIPTIVDAAFKERHYGEYTGKNKWEIQKLVGEKTFKQIRRGWDLPISGGETLKDVYARVVAGYRKHIHPALTQGRNVLFVTHGNTNRAIIKHLENISDAAIADVEMRTGEAIVYLLSEGKIVKKEKRAINTSPREQ